MIPLRADEVIDGTNYTCLDCFKDHLDGTNTKCSHFQRDIEAGPFKVTTVVDYSAYVAQ